MPIDPLSIRFEAALGSARPAEALDALARSLLAEGMSQQAMYDLFDHQRAAHEADETEKLHDAILDTMDRIVGWCGPDARLFSRRGDPTPDHLADRWVAPFYLNVLHGNYASGMLSPAERDRFAAKARAAVAVVDAGVVDALLGEDDWRPRTVAAWLCGLKAWRGYAGRIGDLLAEGRHGLAGQAYCFALACFGDRPSAAGLCGYLDARLRQPDWGGNEMLAAAALTWIGRGLGADLAAPYLKPGGPWDEFRPDLRVPGALAETIHRFDEWMRATHLLFGDAG